MSTGSHKKPLPLLVRILILGVLAVVFVYNVTHEGEISLSLLIAGGLLAAVGIDRNARSGE